VARRGTRKTPYELFTGRKPYVGHIVPFGTEVYSLVKDRRLEKFDPRSVKGFIVGFTERRNTYRVYRSDINRVIVTCDVIFSPHKDEMKRLGAGGTGLMDLGRPTGAQSEGDMFPGFSHGPMEAVSIGASNQADPPMHSSTPVMLPSETTQSEVLSPSFSVLSGLADWLQEEQRENANDVVDNRLNGQEGSHLAPEVHQVAQPAEGIQEESGRQAVENDQNVILLM